MNSIINSHLVVRTMILSQVMMRSTKIIARRRYVISKISANAMLLWWHETYTYRHMVQLPKKWNRMRQSHIWPDCTTVNQACKFMICYPMPPDSKHIHLTHLHLNTWVAAIISSCTSCWFMVTNSCQAGAQADRVDVDHPPNTKLFNLLFLLANRIQHIHLHSDSLAYQFIIG